jgi:glycosyltransferase involved in cell wall biosynthesis
MANIDTKIIAFGAVVIGRNEGERLRSCLASVSHAVHIVYVDSGSTDNSLASAREMGAEVLELDMTVPFTAARARNSGFRRIQELDRTLSYVQFIDGDCQMINIWPQLAGSFLECNPSVAAVTGRRRERFPERSIYNWLCDMEWSGPPGEVRSFGGDVMMRASALDVAGGYRDDMIAGEEPELCVRLRRANWRIWRLDAEMTLHDAAMIRFSQWWRRSLRAGYSFGLGAHLHGGPPEYHKVRESRRAWLWGIFLPAVCAVSQFELGSLGALLWALYPLQVMRLILKGKGPLPERMKIAFFQTLGRIPEGLGQLLFMRDRLFRRRRRLIEYK